MISCLLPTILLSFAQQAAQPVQSVQAPAQTPAAIATAMLAKYYNTHTLSGTIKLTQTAAGKSITVETVLAYERPSKFRLDQRMFGGSEERTTSNVCDGSQYAYTAPPLRNEPAKRIENYPAIGKPTPPVGDLYRIMSPTLVDPNPVLDIVIARREDHQYFVARIASCVSMGRTKIGNYDLNVLVGDWRETPGSTPSAKYEMDVADDGTLIRFALKQVFAVPPDASKVSGKTVAQTSTQPFEVLSVWDLDLKLDGVVAPALFKL